MSGGTIYRAAFLAVVLGTVSFAAAYGQAQEAPSASTSPAGAPTAHQPYSTDTPTGVLLGDPQARAILTQYVPAVVNSQNEAGRSMSLKQMQPYAKDMLSDAVLAEIDGALAKLNK